MRLKFQVTMGGECDWETFKREFNLPATAAAKDAAALVQAEMDQMARESGEKNNIQNATARVEVWLAGQEEDHFIDANITKV